MDSKHKKRAFVVLPLQLFDLQYITKIIKNCDIDIVYFIEDPHYFTRLPFHKQKIAYQRSSMKHYQIEIINTISIKTKYIDALDVPRSIYNDLVNEYESVYAFDPIDK